MNYETQKSRWREEKELNAELWAIAKALLLIAGTCFIVGFISAMWY